MHVTLDNLSPSSTVQRRNFLKLKLLTRTSTKVLSTPVLLNEIKNRLTSIAGLNIIQLTIKKLHLPDLTVWRHGSIACNRVFHTAERTEQEQLIQHCYKLLKKFKPSTGRKDAPLF